MKSEGTKESRSDEEDGKYICFNTSEYLWYNADSHVLICLTIDRRVLTHLNYLTNYFFLISTVYLHCKCLTFIQSASFALFFNSMC